MSERFPEDGERPSLTVSEQQAAVNLEQRARYLDEHLILKEQGEPVWIRVNFGQTEKIGPRVEVYYYDGGDLQGFIEGDDQTGYWASRCSLKTRKMPQRLNTEVLTIRNEAEQMLLDYLSETTPQ